MNTILHGPQRQFVKWGLVFLVVVVAAGIAVGIILPALPPNKSASSTGYYCTRCGLKTFVHEVHRLDPQRTLQHSETETAASPLSAWHGERYGAACDHEWQRLFISSRGYLQSGSFKMRAGTAESGCFSTPELLYLGPDDRTMLNDLYKKDPAACQDYIRSRLQPGEAGSKP